VRAHTHLRRSNEGVLEQELDLAGLVGKKRKGWRDPWLPNTSPAFGNPAR